MIPSVLDPLHLFAAVSYDVDVPLIDQTSNQFSLLGGLVVCAVLVCLVFLLTTTRSAGHKVLRDPVPFHHSSRPPSTSTHTRRRG